jgi:hypothetical protein
MDGLIGLLVSPHVGMVHNEKHEVLKPLPRMVDLLAHALKNTALVTMELVARTAR